MLQRTAGNRKLPPIVRNIDQQFGRSCIRCVVSFSGQLYLPFRHINISIDNQPPCIGLPNLLAPSINRIHDGGRVAEEGHVKQVEIKPLFQSDPPAVCLDNTPELGTRHQINAPAGLLVDGLGDLFTHALIPFPDIFHSDQPTEERTIWIKPESPSISADRMLNWHLRMIDDRQHSRRGMGHGIRLDFGINIPAPVRCKFSRCELEHARLVGRRNVRNVTDFTVFIDVFGDKPQSYAIVAIKRECSTSPVNRNNSHLRE